MPSSFWAAWTSSAACERCASRWLGGGGDPAVEGEVAVEAAVGQEAEEGEKGGAARGGVATAAAEAGGMGGGTGR